MSDIATAQPRHHLLKILGVSFGIASALGSAIGAGILRSPTLIAGSIPDSTLIIGLWVFGAVHITLGANIIAELGTAIPRTGGVYNFVHRAIGDIGGLAVGWSDWLSYLAAMAGTSVSFGEFLPALWPAAADHKLGVALAVQVTLLITNAAGLREGRFVQLVTSFAKATMLAAFIVAAVVFVAPAEPETHLAASPVWGWASLVIAYQWVVGAYAGWWTPVYFAGENVNPEKAIPRALLLGIICTAILYIGLNAALLHALGVDGVAASPLPFTTVMDRLGGGALPALLFAITAMLTVSSCTNSEFMGGPRVLYALAEDGLLPRIFASVSRGGTPMPALLLTAVCAIALTLTNQFEFVFGLVGTFSVATAALTDFSFFVLRWREPDLRRPFRAMGYPVLPALVLGLDTGLLVLIAMADPLGSAFAVGMFIACIPFAIIARRAQRKATGQTVGVLD